MTQPRTQYSELAKQENLPETAYLWRDDENDLWVRESEAELAYNLDAGESRVVAKYILVSLFTISNKIVVEPLTE